MGDKDDVFFGQDMFLMPMSEIGKMENFTKHLPECEPIKFKPIEFESLTTPTFRPSGDRMPSFNFDIPKEDMEKYKKWIERPLFDAAIDPYESMMERFGRHIISMVIRSYPKVNKPKNLKYPLKRRKKRILKKWAKRFGTIPNEIVFPKAELEIGVAPDENGLLLYDVSVKPKKQE